LARPKVAAAIGAASRVLQWRSIPAFVYRMPSLTPHEDFTAGEIDRPKMITIRRADGGQQVVDFTKKFVDAGRAVT
jgi:hypothetical protein